MAEYQSPFSAAHRKPVYIYNNDPRASSSAAYRKFASRAGAEVVQKNIPNIQIQSGTAGDYREPPEYSNAFNGGYFYTLSNYPYIFYMYKYSTSYQFLSSSKNDTAYIYSNRPIISNDHPEYNAVISINPSGNVAWGKKIIAQYMGSPLYPALPSSLGVYCVADTVNRVPPDYEYEAGTSIYNLNPNGSVLWTKILKTDFSFAGCATDDNGIIIGSHRDLYRDRVDLTKIDKNGNIVWSNSYLGIEVSQIFSAYIIQKGDYIYMSNWDRDISRPPYYPYSIYWSKISYETGELIWSKKTDTNIYERQNSGDFFYWTGSAVDNNGNIYTVSNSIDGINVFKVNSIGDFEWSNIYIGTYTNQNIITITNSGDILIGYSSSATENVYSSGVIKISSSGQIIYSKKFLEKQIEYDEFDVPTNIFYNQLSLYNVSSSNNYVYLLIGPGKVVKLKINDLYKNVNTLVYSDDIYGTLYEEYFMTVDESIITNTSPYFVSHGSGPISSVVAFEAEEYPNTYISIQDVTQEELIGDSYESPRRSILQYEEDI